MDSTDVCPNCGRSFVPIDGHRCLQNEEDMINQIDETEDSTPFLDKVVKESMSYDESAFTSVQRNDIATSDIEESEENFLERTEGERDLSPLPLLKKNPLINEGNLNSPPEEQSFMEENQKKVFEEFSALGENYENVLAFLDIDISLHSDDSVDIVLQHGNPLDGLPSEILVTDDSNQRKDVKFAIVSKGQISSTDVVMAKTDPDLISNKKNIREIILKGDGGHLNPSLLLESNEQKNTLEETFPNDSKAGPSRVGSRGHSRTNSPLKHSRKKTSPSGKCGKTLCSKRNYKNRMLLHEQETPPEGALAALSSSNQQQIAIKEAQVISPSDNKAVTSRVDHRGNSRAEKHSTQKTLSSGKCEKTLCSKRNKNFTLLHGQKNPPEGASAALPSGSQVDPSRPDLSDHSRNETKYSQEETFACSQCGETFSSKESCAAHMLMHEHQNTSKENSGDFSSSNQAEPSRPCHSRHSRTGSKKSPLKHSTEKLFPCYECGKVLQSKRSFERHLFLHSKRKPYACQDCGKTFATENNFKRHNRRHTGEESCLCSVCGKRFFRYSYLREHLRIHTGEKPFVCESCGQAFTFRSNYYVHRRSHTK
ncbi:unnamed protein product [Larinioides sclopetarius]|uniref:C2H2-type domain-containing protein n=1 Tax=Larinioides sclopetarius TaxID=280406 RepID=A0AAV2BP23_9ARAC